MDAEDKVQFTGMTPGKWKVNGVDCEADLNGILTLTVAGDMTINNASFVAQVDIKDAGGNTLTTGDLKDGNVTFTMEKGTKAGTGFMSNDKYYAYGEKVTLPLADTSKVEIGYIVVQIDNEKPQYRKVGTDAGYTALSGSGTGFIMRTNGGDWTYMEGDSFTVPDSNVEIRKGYVAVTYKNANIDEKASDAYASVTDGKFTVTYTVTGLQAGDNVTVTFTSGNTNLAASGANVDTFAALSSEMTRTVELTVADKTQGVIGITFTAVH